MEMIGVREAKKILARNIRQLPDEMIPVSDALGRFISKEIFSPIDVPPFDNSAMDGFAFCHEPNKTNYRIAANIQAGDTATYSLKKGEAARIFTGAPIPKGADTVIQQELVTVINDIISFDKASVQVGDNIRLCGAQCKVGETIMKQGTCITPGVAALLSSIGLGHISVVRYPKVKVIITGNELVEPGVLLRHGEIYNSNRLSISAYLKLSGITDAQFVHVKDNYEELRSRVQEALKACDVLILSGGISSGEYDFVYRVLEEEGVQPLFYKVRQKPGKPLYAGKKDNTFIFALPGNPAAVIICFNQYVKPCLSFMAGNGKPFSYSVLLPLAHDWVKKTPLANILKAEVKNGEVTILSGQDSFNLQPFVSVNAFALLYEEDTKKNKGDLIEIYYW
ncbi:MAG: molybdopterin molybdotransferase MoeA [Bacteroidetes bacterium]|nr:molybdopterin molybdotransferase MoeA [Bacteroidota bacterium]MBS1541259.1 molybdopterin molybdotransferase MoeA [Bacteroidota bacterium]